jgi:hypothetical protein
MRSRTVKTDRCAARTCRTARPREWPRCPRRACRLPNAPWNTRRTSDRRGLSATACGRPGTSGEIRRSARRRW